MTYEEASKRQVELLKSKVYTVIKPWFQDQLGNPHYHLDDSSKEECEKQVLSNCTDMLKSFYAKRQRASFKLIQGGKT
jgi:hypothetical protein